MISGRSIRWGLQLDTLWPVEPKPPRAIAVWLEWLDDELEEPHVLLELDQPDDRDEDEPQLTICPCGLMHSRGDIDAAMAAVPVPSRISLMAVERLIARILTGEANVFS